MQRTILIGICCSLIGLKFWIPELSADSVWSVSQAFAFLRGSFGADEASGFYMPGLGSVLLTIWFKIFGITEATLKLWYIILKIFSLFLLISQFRKQQESQWVPVLLSALVLFDPYLSPERTETVGLFIYLLAERFLSDHRMKVYTISILLWWVHPVAGLFYGIIQIDSFKKLLVLLLPILLMVLFLGESMGIWLQTLFVRLQPESLWEQCKEIKYMIPLQIFGGMMLFQSGLLKPYLKKFIWVFPILLLAGKPYYMFWVQFFLISHLAQIPSESFSGYKRTILTSLSFICIYITSIFPILETRVLNQGYAEMYHQSIEYRSHMDTPDFCVPELAVPFLQKAPPARLVSNEGIEPKLHRAGPGFTALTYIKKNATDTPIECIPTQNYIHYHLWLTPADSFKTGLFLYRTQK